MAVNKVIFGGETVIDLTADTVTADKMLSGTTAHGKNGSPVTGTIESFDGAYECSGESTGGGGGVNCIVNVTTTDGGETWTADKTYAEITAIVESGALPVVAANLTEIFGSAIIFFCPLSINLGDGFAFANFTPSIGSELVVSMYPDDSVEVAMIPFDRGG